MGPNSEIVIGGQVANGSAELQLNKTLLSTEEFCRVYPAYSTSTVILHNVLRDLMLRRDSRHISVVDGSIWGVQRYFLVGETKLSGQKLYMIFHIDEDIDFIWLSKLVRQIQQDPETPTYQVVLCVFGNDSVVYQDIFLDLPQFKIQTKDISNCPSGL